MDRSSKLILAALALGIWANAAPLLRPTPAQAQDNAAQILDQVAHDLHNIALGTCVNHRLCGS